LSRWARVRLSVRSLTATISRSAPCAMSARVKFRPIRPKPLMPILALMCAPVRCSGGGCGTGDAQPCGGRAASRGRHAPTTPDSDEQTRGLIDGVRESRLDVRPVDDVPERLDVVRSDVLVVE